MAKTLLMCVGEFRKEGKMKGKPDDQRGVYGYDLL